MSDVKLYLGDCLEILPTLAAGSVDAVITDPPFGTGTAEWDVDPAIQVWAEMRRLCPDGPIAVLGYAKQLFQWAKYFDGMELIGFIVWHKYNELNVSRGLTRVHQDIAIWGRTITQIRAGDIREPYGKAGEKYWSKRGGNGVADRIIENLKKKGIDRRPDGKRCTDLWKIPAPGAGFNRHLRLHPNEKPTELYNRLVRLLTDRDETVIDPFMGSGTTGVACVQTGRNFIGIEIVENYFKIAEKRIKQAQMQLALPV